VTESLAGQGAFVDMQGFSLDDVGPTAERMLWLRGGFPRSFLAANDEASFTWRNDFLRSFIERDFGTLGLGATPASLGRLWRMVAHHHGQYPNASEFGRSLGETHKTVLRHLEMLAAAFMVRLLPPWFEHLGKRLVRSPKVYVRDSGLLHALLGIPDESALLGHPKLGGSWEGFATEQIIARLPHDDCHFWATQSGAGVDKSVYVRISFFRQVHVYRLESARGAGNRPHDHRAIPSDHQAAAVSRLHHSHGRWAGFSRGTSGFRGCVANRPHRDRVPA
jgi:predicted AAA+ superfamily ATPase